MKRLVGGLLLVSVISSWGLQAAQDNDEYIPVYSTDKAGEIVATIGLYQRSQLRNFLMYSHKEHFDGGSSLFIFEDFLPQDRAVAQELFSVLVMMADVTKTDAERQVPEVIENNVSQLLALYRLAYYLLPTDAEQCEDYYSKVIDSIKHKLLQLVYAQPPEDQVAFIKDNIIAVVGSDALFMQKLFNEAVRNNRWAVVRYLLQSQDPGARTINVNVSYERGITPLMLAVQSEHNALQTVTLLLEAGAYPNRRDVEGLTASHYAYLQMNQDVIDLLPVPALDTKNQRDFLVGALDHYGNRSNPEKVQKFLELFRTSPVRINLTEYTDSFLDRYITSHIRLANKEVLALLLAYAQPDEIAGMALRLLVDQILTNLEGERQQEFLSIVMPYVPRVIIDNAQGMYKYRHRLESIQYRQDLDSLQILNDAYRAYLTDALLQEITQETKDLNKIQELLDKGADIYATNRLGESLIDVADAQDNAALDYLFEPYRRAE